VSLNDTSAYFFGRAFGRHKLIGLSPNKTVEGFVGAMISNIFVSFFLSAYLLKDSNFWTCIPSKFSVSPFEDYQCESMHPIYQMQEYPLHFEFMGNTTF